MRKAFVRKSAHQGILDKNQKMTNFTVICSLNFDHALVINFLAPKWKCNSCLITFQKLIQRLKTTDCVDRSGRRPAALLPAASWRDRHASASQLETLSNFD